MEQVSSDELKRAIPFRMTGRGWVRLYARWRDAVSKAETALEALIMPFLQCSETQYSTYAVAQEAPILRT
jgi:hypothetical protein